MSVCIKHGVITKHKYKKGVCLNCGRHRGQVENISSGEAHDEPEASIGAEHPQTIVAETVTYPLTTRKDLHNQWEPGDVPEDLTSPYNKDKI